MKRYILIISYYIWGWAGEGKMPVTGTGYPAENYTAGTGCKVGY